MGQQKGLHRIIRLKLAENLSGQGTAGADGLGRLQPDQSGDIGQIGLPATPDDGVALAHQESVSRFQWRHRVCNRRRAVEPSNDGFPAPVHYVEQQPAIALAKFYRLEHREIGGHRNFASRVPGRQVQVGDHLISGMQRVHGKMDRALNEFVWTDLAE